MMTVLVLGMVATGVIVAPSSMKAGKQYQARKEAQPFLLSTGSVTVLSINNGVVKFRDDSTGREYGNTVEVFNDNYSAK